MPGVSGPGQDSGHSGSTVDGAAEPGQSARDSAASVGGGGGDAEVRSTAVDEGLPAPDLLSVIGGLVALAIAGGVSGALSFREAAAARARVDAARAEFFGPRA